MLLTTRYIVDHYRPVVHDTVSESYKSDYNVDLHSYIST